MASKKILYAAVAIGVAAIISALAIPANDKALQNLSAYEKTNEILKQKLAEQGIDISSPIKLKEQDDITKYCSFFTSEEKQKLVQYCTSTELKDADGKFLGNIHMVGSPDEPKIILALIQVDPFMTQIDSVKDTINIIVQNVICNCWDEAQPNTFQSVEQWVDGLREFHLSDTKPHSKSTELVLRDRVLQLELTTNNDGYLWQFFIYT
jgi:hypothetical protein